MYGLFAEHSDERLPTPHPSLPLQMAALRRPIRLGAGWLASRPKRSEGSGSSGARRSAWPFYVGIADGMSILLPTKTKNGKKIGARTDRFEVSVYAASAVPDDDDALLPELCSDPFF